MTVPPLGATFAADDVLWYVVAAIAAGFALAFVASVRRFVRWCGRRVKAGFLDWFQEAVDEHVEPKFEAVRQNSLDAAEIVRVEMLATSASVKEELRVHTAEEGAIVKRIVDQAIAPIAATLADRDDVFDRLEHTMTETQDRIASIEETLKNGHS